MCQKRGSVEGKPVVYSEVRDEERCRDILRCENVRHLDPTSEEFVLLGSGVRVVGMLHNL